MSEQKTSNNEIQKETDWKSTGEPSTTARVIASIIVLSLGIIIAAVIMLLKAKPEEKKPEGKYALVNTMVVKKVAVQTVIKASGTVIPAREFTLKPEVGGRIIELAKELMPGGILRNGELIARIDSHDYREALTQAMARQKDAEAMLRIEEGFAAVAKADFELSGPEGNQTTDMRDLALRKPQMARMRAALEIAKSQVALAKKNLSRTELRASTNLLVINEALELSQVVSPQAPVATLVGADAFWVRLSVPLAELSWLATKEELNLGNLKCSVELPADGKSFVKREARVLKILSDLNPQSRTAKILLEVEDPLNIYNTSGTARPRLLLGAYVNAKLQGKVIADGVIVKRIHIHNGNTVWVMNEDNELEIRSVEIARYREDDVVVTAGLASGERIVTSSISQALPGLKLRDYADKLAEDKAKKDKAAEEKSSTDTQPESR